MVASALLVTTLAVTVVALCDVLRRDELTARQAAVYLSLFSALFLVRVVGQVIVVLRAPKWLPPMSEWNLVPYRLLLPIQLGFLVILGAIVGSLVRGSGWLAGTSPGFGRLLIGLSLLYAASMVVRYGVRMHRRPSERWFGGAIPIVFHVVLAAFLFTWGRHHVTG